MQVDISVFYFVFFGEERLFEFGSGSHIPHDFAFSFMSHFMPGKQHSRRFPLESMLQAFSIRRLRVSGCLDVLIENIQSRRAKGVISVHEPIARESVVRALSRSIGTLVSGSSPTRVISIATMSPISLPTAERMALPITSRRPPQSFALRADRKGRLLMVPSTIIASAASCLSSFTPAFWGKVNMPLGPISVLKRIVGLVFCRLAGFMHC